MSHPMDYKKSGVDVQAGDDLVDWLHQSDDSQTYSSINSSEKKIFKPHQIEIQKKLKSRVVSGIGGFAALFNAQFDDIKNPLLVSCTDGVGTKVKLASYFNDYSTVGYDLVAMCANDLICTGGRPLFFLDYYASGKLNLEHAKQFLTSVKNACTESEMILIGGETAEMPGIYQDNDFDCAGFSVGIVDQSKTWGADKVMSGDIVIGLESSGFHSNGFSLIRKVFEGQFNEYRKWLMEPTRLYVEAATILRSEFNIKAACHITGGGIENIPRVLPADLKVQLKHWNMPDCFKYVKEKSSLNQTEMLSTFNCGMGFLIIVSEAESLKILNRLKDIGYKNQILGTVLTKTNLNEASVEFC
jgi:phosphoribosylformylglycinamidine cyclo-ligase